MIFSLITVFFSFFTSKSSKKQFTACSLLQQGTYYSTLVVVLPLRFLSCRSDSNKNTKNTCLFQFSFFYLLGELETNTRKIEIQKGGNYTGMIEINQIIHALVKQISINSHYFAICELNRLKKCN